MNRIHGVALLIGSYLLIDQTRPVFAHDEGPLTPATLWRSWQWDPFVLATIALGVVLYWRGVRALWQNAGRGRGVTERQVGLFIAGMAVVAFALLSPLAALSDALFSAHMVQHILLMNVAAPLLVWGAQPSILMWAMPQPTRRGLARWWQRRTLLLAGWRLLNQPLAVWTLYAATLWIWHAPVFYQAAVASDLVHFWEHVGFMGSALLFWWVLEQPSSHRAFHVGAAILFLFTTALHSGLLAALLTFAPRPLYPIYAQTVGNWGLRPLADQQLAGVIMWVPVGFVYLAAVLWRIGRQLTQADNLLESNLEGK